MVKYNHLKAFFIKFNLIYFSFFFLNRETVYFNLKIYDVLLNNRYRLTDTFILNYQSQFKYNWINPKSGFIKLITNDFDKNFSFEFSEFYKNSNINYHNDIDYLESIIAFKKNFGFIKKDNKFNSVVLYKLHGLKMNFYKNNFNLEDYSEFNDYDDNTVFENEKINKNLSNKYYIKHNYTEDSDSQFNNKNIDIKYKSFSLFKKNRGILNDLLIKKNLKQYKFNKIIKNFIKKPPYNSIQRYEFKLINMLIRTNFFTNFKDATFFIKNGYVLVNGSIVKNVNHLLNLNDVVRVSYNKYYFLYYRKGLHNLINNIGKYNSYLWRINKNKFNPHKQQTNHTPNWILRSLYFKEDFPRYLEVDYISMTLVILYKSYDFKDYDFYGLKFINAYLMRLYNWKYIT